MIQKIHKSPFEKISAANFPEQTAAAGSSFQIANAGRKSRGVTPSQTVEDVEEAVCVAECNEGIQPYRGHRSLCSAVCSNSAKKITLSSPLKPSLTISAKVAASTGPDVTRPASPSETAIMKSVSNLLVFKIKNETMKAKCYAIGWIGGGTEQTVTL